MNKFIKYDIENGLTLIKCAIRNVLYDLETGELTEYDFGEYVAPALIELCMEECGWEEKGPITYFSNGKYFSFIGGQIEILDDSLNINLNKLI